MDNKSIKKIMSLTMKQLYKTSFVKYDYNREYVKQMLIVIESEMNSEQLKQYYEVFKPMLEEELKQID